jgi:predicted N-acetyltransferase YhbS
MKRPGILSRLKVELQRGFLARTPLETHLFPPLSLPIVFRPYRDEDFDSCISIYRKNEPGRFPEGHAPAFEKFLRSNPKTCIVAELESKVIACASMTCEAPDLAMLLYGLVDPQYQGSRIGSTLTLLRLAQLPPGPTKILVLICAVNASMPFYRRFGFKQYGEWKAAEDGKDHPAAVLSLSHWELQRLKEALERRRMRVAGKLTLYPSQNIRGEVIYVPEGAQIMWHPREPQKPGGEANDNLIKSSDA